MQEESLMRCHREKVHEERIKGKIRHRSAGKKYIDRDMSERSRVRGDVLKRKRVHEVQKA